MESDSLPFEIFTELASETRCDILTNLSQKNTKQSEIATKMDMTMQETHRQISRLQKSGLIDKNPDGTFDLTEYGKIVTKQIDHLTILGKFGTEINKYSIDGIPTSFLQSISALSNGKMVKSVTAVLEICKTIFSDADEFLKIIAPQVVSSFDGMFDDKLEGGFKIQYIYGKNTIVPKSTINTNDKTRDRELLSQGILDRRMVDVVNFGLVITDKHAGLILITNPQEPEINFMLVGEDDDFRNWCIALFEDTWDNAYDFDISKTNLI